MEREPVIELRDVTKVYQMGENEVHALNGVNLTIYEGTYVAIVGASGSGKSTLMNLIGLLDRPTSGVCLVRGTDISQLSKSQLSDLRNREIGFVFQQFNLLPRTSARRQVELPLFYANVPRREAVPRTMEALRKVGLENRADHRPDELSGGQQQRVAIARALVNQPHLLLADEPTGALDSHTGQEVLALFDELHAQGLTLAVVTHDWKVARRAERIVTISDGQVVDDRLVSSEERAATASQPVAVGLGSESFLSRDVGAVHDGVVLAANGNGHANGVQPGATPQSGAAQDPAAQEPAAKDAAVQGAALADEKAVQP